MNKVKWGIISTAKIGVEKVIPAMQKGQYSEIVAIASRSEEKAKSAAALLGIPTYYGSYEALLADPNIDAVYNPLPNHLHVPISVAAIEAGKHVLCEKPIALSSAEAQLLVEKAAGNPKIKVMEAFMYRFHPQWQTAKAIADSGRIGTVITIHSIFSYFNDDPANIRNKVEWGGGGLMDIGCYCISLARFILDREPARVSGHMEIDPQFKVDRVASGMLEFDDGQTATFTCATQLTPYQRVNIFGTAGRIEIEIPFNAPPDKPTRLWVLDKNGTEEKVFDVCDQYTIQGDLFCRAIMEDTPVPTPLSDAVANMKVIEAVAQSARSGQWVQVQ